MVDRLPVLCIAVGIASQLAYSTLLKRFPFMELTSMEFIGSTVMLVWPETTVVLAVKYVLTQLTVR